MAQPVVMRTLENDDDEFFLHIHSFINRHFYKILYKIAYLILIFNQFMSGTLIFVGYMSNTIPCPPYLLSGNWKVWLSLKIN